MSLIGGARSSSRKWRCYFFQGAQPRGNGIPRRRLRQFVGWCGSSGRGARVVRNRVCITTGWMSMRGGVHVDRIPTQTTTERLFPSQQFKQRGFFAAIDTACVGHLHDMVVGSV